MFRLPKVSYPTNINADLDGQLAARAAAGDQSAFGRIMKHHDKSLRGFIALRTGPNVAEDVAQETWTACWLALPNYAGKSRFKAWLYGIALNKCADHFRSKHHKEDSASHEMDEIASVDGLTQMDRVVDTEAVRTALKCLPPVQCEVVELYYFAQLSLPEIAIAVGRNLNTVKYQFYRAHDQLSKQLKAEL